MNNRVLGVGIVGAGPVTQAIHLPTLSRMTDLYNVVHVMDVASDVAEAVASRVGARSSTTLEAVLEDPEVQVVAVCSPPQFHAQQVIAAMEAGKRAVLCEKPFATSQEEAQAIAEAAERYGVPVIVGAMHVFDEAWRAGYEAWKALGEQAHVVRSTMVLAPNDRYEDWATEVLNRPDIQMGGDGGDPAAYAQMMLPAAILGLAVHDLPLVRALLPEAGELAVDSARLIPPFGYLISGSRGDAQVELVASVNDHWESHWELEAVAERTTLNVRFTPSFVHAGSAVATLRHPDGTSQVFGPYTHNGYESEWRSLHAAASGAVEAVPAPAVFIDDLSFVLETAGKSAVATAKEIS